MPPTLVAAPRVGAGSGAGVGASCSLMTRMGSPVISSAACSREGGGVAKSSRGVAALGAQPGARACGGLPASCRRWRSACAPRAPASAQSRSALPPAQGRSRLPHGWCPAAARGLQGGEARGWEVRHTGWTRNLPHPCWLLLQGWLAAKQALKRTPGHRAGGQCQGAEERDCNACHGALDDCCLPPIKLPCQEASRGRVERRN